MFRFNYFSLVFFLLFSFTCSAEVINVSGNIIASPCVLDLDNSDFQVNFSKMYKGLFSKPGSYGTEKNIRITVKSCPPTTSYVEFHFDGQPDNGDSLSFSNSGSAENLAVQIKSLSETWENTSIYPGSYVKIPIETKTNTALLSMVARPYTKVGGGTSGTLRTTVNITLSYQ
ncbi:fimbrial protein [Klebsiella grimontii]|uniref:fimbrial protein n=1 Tax=Klebsiella grimontii TaxID=2058152 RepID=UPI001052566B|nr:fimbrial protein [Klebsiella grimontii]TCZ55664.1 type 1 fimbrial protein [Klebsiella grimontii]